MSKFAKVVVSACVIFGFVVLSGIVIGLRTDAGHTTPGPLGLILAVALIGAIRAIWKSKGDENQSSSDNDSILQK